MYDRTCVCMYVKLCAIDRGRVLEREHVCVPVSMCMRVCESGFGERACVCTCEHMYVSACVCVCGRERKRERERASV